MTETTTTPPCYICRCEEVTRRDIERAIDEGALTVDDVKRRTRSGMGLCQGIFCVPVMVALLERATGANLGEIVPMTARPPARLLPLATLANLEE